MEELISIGKILNFHGIKGEVKVGYTRGKETQIGDLKSVYVELDGENTLFNIVSVRFHKQHALIKFKELNSINDVERVKGKELKIPKLSAEQYLSDDEFLVSDLVGMRVLNKDEELIGKIVEVGTNGASEILEVVDANSKKHLIPFVKALVPIVDMKTKTVIVNDIEGLID